MNEQISDIRPALLALKESSWATLTQGKYRYNGTTHRVLLLPETDCTETPSALLEDAVLKPVDKIIWLLLMMIVTSGFTGTPIREDHDSLQCAGFITVVARG